MSLALDTYVSQYMNANNLTRVEGLSQLTPKNVADWLEDEKNNTPIFMDHLVGLDIQRPSWSFEGGFFNKSLVIPIGNYYVYKGNFVTIGCGIANIFASFFLSAYIKLKYARYYNFARKANFVCFCINTFANIQRDVINVDESVILPTYHPLFTTLSFVTSLAVWVTALVEMNIFRQSIQG